MYIKNPTDPVQHSMVREIRDILKSVIWQHTHTIHIEYYYKFVCFLLNGSIDDIRVDILLCKNNRYISKLYNLYKYSSTYLYLLSKMNIVVKFIVKYW